MDVISEKRKTMKEKISELFSYNACPNKICNFCEHFKNSYNCEKYKKEALVGHLIQNGVTIQKWIPVTEGLPEKWQDIIAYDAKNQEIHLAYMTEDAWVGVRMNGKVTHWMPLPEPPKEVE